MTDDQADQHRTAIVTGAGRGIGAAIAARLDAGAAHDAGEQRRAKAGLQGFTKTVAMELGKFGVIANAVAPGFIVTDMTRATAERLGQTFEEFSANRVAGIPVNRARTPDDVSAAVSFFCSEGAVFVSGQVLYVACGPRG